MGERFCSRDQTHSDVRKYFSEKYVIPSSKSSEDQKQKVFTVIWEYIWPEFVGFIRADRPFLSDHPALKSRWGDAKSRWGTRPAYNLSTGFTVC